MTVRHGPLQRSLAPVAGLAIAIGAAGAAFALAADDGTDEAAAETASLGYKALKHWDIVIPNEIWTPVEDSIPIPHSGGSGFAAEQVGPMKLRVDTNGDGKLDTDVRGSTGFLKLRGKDEAGEAFSYAVRFVNERGKYKFAPGGAMIGKLNGTPIQVVDRNANGRYDDYGRDAIVVGSTDGASLLSRVVNAGDELFSFEISADGTRVEYSPYVGPTASLDVSSEHDSYGELISAVIEHEDGEVFFNAARDSGALKVPAGDYRFVYGYAERGEESVQIRGGKMLALHLNANDERVVEWGGPIVAEFDHVVDGDTITVRPNVAFYGQSGEEYHTFKPDAKSPKIIVSDKKTRKIYLEGRFGGC